MRTAAGTPTTGTTLSLKRTIAAPRAQVFDAWTRPEMVRQWFAAGEEYEGTGAEVDLRVGGEFRMGMRHIPTGKTHRATGVFREIRSPERLVFTWTWEGEKSSGETLVTIDLRDPGDGRTEMSFRHDLFPSTKERDQHAQGWTACFDRLAGAVSA